MRKIVLNCMVLAGLFIGCKPIEEPLSEVRQENYCLDESFKAQLTWEEPTLQSVTEMIPLTGVIEPNPDKVIQFVSLVGGIISDTYFSLGNRVKKGQILAELRSTELTHLQSQSKILETRIAVAEKNLRTVQSMFDDEIVPQKELLEAQSDLDMLRVEMERIQANLGLFSASTEKGVFQIKSPISGIVTAKSISAGSRISAEGDPLFTISDLSEVWAMANIYATNVTNISQGMPVEIKTLSYPDEVFEGRINVISQVLDEEARVMKARIVLPNPTLKLKPGMIIDLTASKDLNTEALSIPASALVFDDNQNFVVVYHDDCELENRKVEVISRSNNMVYLAAGLQPEEKILSGNHLLVYEQIKNFQR